MASAPSCQRCKTRRACRWRSSSRPSLPGRFQQSTRSARTRWRHSSRRASNCAAATLRPRTSCRRGSRCTGRVRRRGRFPPHTLRGPAQSSPWDIGSRRRTRCCGLPLLTLVGSLGAARASATRAIGGDGAGAGNGLRGTDAACVPSRTQALVRCAETGAVAVCPAEQGRAGEPSRQ